VKAEVQKANGDWKTVALGDVAEFVRGINFKPDDVVPTDTPGSVACMRTKNVQAELDMSDVWAVGERFVKREDQFLRPGDILVSSANSWNLVGKCCWIPGLPWRTTFGGFVSVLRPHPSKVEPRFLFRWFSSDRIQTTLRSFGQQTTNISNLNTDRCLKLPLPLPPLAEQRRIAEVLDRAEALRAKRRAALAQLDSLTQSLFLELFGDLRKHKLVSLESLASTKRHALSSGPFGSSLTSKHYVDEGILVLRGLNVTAGEITLHDCKFISESKARELSRSLISPMDIVIVAVGASGFACLIPKDFPAAVMSQNFNKISPNLDRVDPTYLVFLLNSSFIQRQFFQNITDTVRTFLSLTKIKKVSVPLPPIELQREFARRVRAVEKLKTAQRASLAELDALFTTLQQRAFRGEL